MPNKPKKALSIPVNWYDSFAKIALAIAKTDACPVNLKSETERLITIFVDQISTLLTRAHSGLGSDFG